MVAMFIGLFLLSGIASSYISSKKASINRSQTSLLEDNGRLALEIITKSLEHTGHAPSGTFTNNNPFIMNIGDVVSDTCPDGATNIVDQVAFVATAKATADDDVLVQDSIGVVFHGDDNVFTDCSGNILTASAAIPAVSGCRLRPLSTHEDDRNTMTNGSKIYNSFYVDNVSKTLECAGSRSLVAVTIAEGVENMQLMYGVDTDSDKVIERYVNASDMNANQWGSVKSIKVALLVRSMKAVKNTAESKTYTLLDTVIVSPNDLYQRAVFSTTIHLRNSL
jgi:type IV pilus assembly protein PilW